MVSLPSNFISVRVVSKPIKFITVHLNLSKFSCFKPLHLLIRIYQVPVLLVCPLAFSRVKSSFIQTCMLTIKYTSANYCFSFVVRKPKSEWYVLAKRHPGAGGAKQERLFLQARLKVLNEGKLKPVLFLMNCLYFVRK